MQTVFTSLPECVFSGQKGDSRKSDPRWVLLWKEANRMERFFQKKHLIENLNNRPQSKRITGRFSIGL